MSGFVDAPFPAEAAVTFSPAADLVLGSVDALDNEDEDSPGTGDGDDFDPPGSLGSVDTVGLRGSSRVAPPAFWDPDEAGEGAPGWT